MKTLDWCPMWTVSCIYSCSWMNQKLQSCELKSSAECEDSPDLFDSSLWTQCECVICFILHLNSKKFVPFLIQIHSHLSNAREIKTMKIFQMKSQSICSFNIMDEFLNILSACYQLLYKRRMISGCRVQTIYTLRRCDH